MKAERESDNELMKPGTPVLKSQFNQRFITNRIITGLSIITFALFMIFIYRLQEIAMLVLAVPLFFLYLYLDFTLGHLYHWEFTNEGFSRRKFLRAKKRFYHYSEISSYQERKRFGNRNSRDFIPDYSEIAIWLLNKNSFEFDEIDFVNYKRMKEFFIARCEENGIEPAPYSE